MELNVLRYQDPRTRTYLGSPAIIRLPDGALLAAHDYFGAGCPRNHEDEEHLSSIYRSEDDGRTWENITHVANAYWSSLFVHQGAAYLFGTTQQYGSIVIRRSDDGGYTWTHPADTGSGLLFPGGARRIAPNYHCAPVPVLFAHGRIYRAFEDNVSDLWGSGFQALVVSAAQDADLLQAASWTMSNRVAFPVEQLPADWPALELPGWLEGNIVDGPGGELWNILRFHAAPRCNYAIRLRLSPDGSRLWYEPETGIIRFPGGGHKFTIRRVGDYYLALVNPCTDEGTGNAFWQRNVLAASVSRNLRDWQITRILVQDDQALSAEESLRQTGFQYVDWFREGADLLYLVRTSYAGANNFHDSNRITFHHEKNFFTGALA